MYCMSREKPPAADPLEEESSDRPGTRGTGGTVAGHAGSLPRSPQNHRTATYRVQLHAGFTFDDAAAIAGYLDALGVSHLYCSPYLQAAPGSTHGYDVTDHQSVNAELGGTLGHETFSAT